MSLSRALGVPVALALACWFADVHDVAAQDRQKYSYKPPPGSTKYVQTHLMDVGDVPDHQVRMAEILSSYSGNGPVYDGVRVVSARSVLVSDYTEGSGHAFSYTVQTLETGDKVFLRTAILTHSSAGADGARRTGFSQVATLVGGTGRFKGIRGTLRTTGLTDLKTGTSGTESEGDYWFEK